MGNRVSDIADDDPKEFPWFHIIQWASESLPAGHVLRYDISAARLAAHTLCQNESILRDSIREEDIAGFILPTFLVDTESEDYNTPGIDEPNPIEFAASLLERLPNLSRVRYDLVPSHLSEDVFWRKFFSLLRRRILQTIASYCLSRSIYFPPIFVLR